MGIDFLGVPRIGVIPLTVQFTDLTTPTPLSWHWYFGDGDESTSQNPSHIYDAIGSYDVRLDLPSGNDQYTVVLLHMNGEDESIIFTDSAFAGTHVWTVVNNAQIDIAQNKFGGASGLFDGTGDYINTPHSSDFFFDTGDFTIDFWIRLNAYAIRHGIWSQYIDLNNFVFLQLVYDGTDKYGVLVNTSLLGTGGPGIIGDYITTSLNTLYHFALVRSGNLAYWFRNGELEPNFPQNFNGSWPNINDIAMVGRSGWGAPAYDTNGWIEEFRISKG